MPGGNLSQAAMSSVHVMSFRFSVSVYVEWASDGMTYAHLYMGKICCSSYLAEITVVTVLSHAIDSRKPFIFEINILAG